MGNLKVQKKDGQLEDFDRNKIIGGVVAAGATQEEAENIATQVEAWAGGAAINGVINSPQIKGKVLELLQQINPAAAAAFEAYRKTTPQG